ncbi:aspartate/glutamate racemase family protein [Amycolatopsis jejuensis]|uniref:aspartate/glutamate racemase family protein n=1 Tax=Amycolatopsis jejuensis TaxID=330084 RepID=UPI00068EDCBB|nr:aspartate/glutamate racemase family protein [Amycolatopsis jejuensis]
MRIKYLVPYAMGEAGIANRALQIPEAALKPDTHVDCVAVRNHPQGPGSPYGRSLSEMYVTEAGLRAEEEGYDALVVDTTSDAGVETLRSRLRIPVVGPGLVAYLLGMLLGRRFSVLTCLERDRPAYERTLVRYGVERWCASIRPTGVTPDPETLFGTEIEAPAEKVLAAAKEAITRDGADVVLLGSTTMHQVAGLVAARLEAPVVNPGPVSLKLAESLVELRLSHSKIAFPSPLVPQDGAWFSLPPLEDR